MRLKFTQDNNLAWPINNHQTKQLYMKKNQKHEHDTEILKAVAQAWHGHSSSSKAITEASEFDAHRRYFRGRPTRFKLEAMRTANNAKEECGSSWDFRQSLWDSYEIISVSKKLERGLMVDNPFSTLDEKGRDGGKRRKESKNSLRNLFNNVSSRRFSHGGRTSPIS